MRKTRKLTRPSEWPNSARIGTTLVLLAAIAFILEPKATAEFIREMLEDLVRPKGRPDVS